MRIDPDDIADLTTLIFSAGLSPDRWGDFLQKLHAFTGGVRTHIFGRDMGTGRLFGLIGAGYDESRVPDYDAHFRHLNVWVDKFAPTLKGTFMSFHEMYPHAELLKTEFYHGWVKPQDDMYRGGGVMLFNEQDRFLAFGGHIRAKDGDTLESDFERLVRLLTPHVQQAFEMNRALQGKSVADFLSGMGPGPGMGDRPAIGIVLLRPDGRVLFANDTAQDWIAAGLPVHVDAGGRLGAAEAAIAGFIGRALHGLNELDGAASATLRTAAGDGATEVALRAARFVPDRQDRSPFGVLHSGDDRALLLTIERWPRRRRDLAGLLRAHGLTAKEAEVALALSRGTSAAEIAKARGVSIHTIRNQRQAILSKLGLGSQLQLASFVLRQRAAPPD